MDQKNKKPNQPATQQMCQALKESAQAAGQEEALNPPNQAPTNQPDPTKPTPS